MLIGLLSLYCPTRSRRQFVRLSHKFKLIWLFTCNYNICDIIHLRRINRLQIHLISLRHKHTHSTSISNQFAIEEFALPRDAVKFVSCPVPKPQTGGKCLRFRKWLATTFHFHRIRSLFDYTFWIGQLSSVACYRLCSCWLCTIVVE